MLHQVTGTFTPTPPFDFEKTLTFIGQFRPALGEQDIHDAVMTKAMSINGQVMVYRLRSTGSVEQPSLSYTLDSEAPISESVHQTARENIAFYLSLSDDLQPFYALAQEDPDFAPYANQLYGYHQVKFASAFENACWAVISQRNLMTVSEGMKDRLTEMFGGSMTLDGVLYRAFPEPFQLVMPSVDEINVAIRNLWKSQGISSVAHAFDEVEESWLRQTPDAEVEKWLLSIKGIGAWSASFIMLRGLGRTNRIPPEERRLLEAAQRVYGRDNLTHEDVLRLAKPYGQLKGYWAHYLRASG